MMMMMILTCQGMSKYEEARRAQAPGLPATGRKARRLLLLLLLLLMSLLLLLLLLISLLLLLLNNLLLLSKVSASHW